MTESNNMEQNSAQPPQEEKSPKKKNWVSKIVGGDLLQSRFVLRQKWMILMLMLFGLVLVYNRYQVETLTKAKEDAQARINYLRENRIELQKRYQETIKISKIAEMLDSTGVGITAGPPFEI
ncbi:MAG: hypothetical protein MJZ99_01035 [Bacteroidales bacterium]|nr:hypothetical protein [Bacteroidales bacterium]